MSKSVSSESKDDHETPKTSRKRGADEGNEDDDEINATSAVGNSTISTTVSDAPAIDQVSDAPVTSDQFMHTPEFRRHFVEFVHVQTLMVLRVATKGWKVVADALIDEGVKSGELIVHDGKDISGAGAYARRERRKLVTRVIFLLNITKVGNRACFLAFNLIVVDIPEGIERIGDYAFRRCSILTTVSFPTTLKSIEAIAFQDCSSLDNVDLLHTNLQQLSYCAFYNCKELKSMKIPDSLQTLGQYVFQKCPKLVPSTIKVNSVNDVTSEVVSHLRSQQLLSTTPPAPPTDEFMLTNDFRRLLVGFVPDDTLMALRSATKAWKAVVEEVIDEGVKSGELIVHDGKDINGAGAYARRQRRKLVTRVIFLLNVTKVGDRACFLAFNLVVFDTPQGVESIGDSAFNNCMSLTTVSFPTTLKSIGEWAFASCESLDNVDLLHTNLEKLGQEAFSGCYQLKSMTIPDSLQTLGVSVFLACSKLVSSNIMVSSWQDTTSEVVAHLRSLQS
ncbi:hypothetical protein TL16_g07322 [Triparma laevis f. inornata]|uniref:Leucine-rich repeat domain, L domain-like n=1 Tax=Triparma laevis f. inornata TaxID=1714386 RepID=A0A9W7AX99_9STRA|nr:hypothetical protein TL16_g07322 [Triparma laevis f. inornata]